MQTKQVLGALFCALFILSACGKKEEVRGKHVANVSFGQKLSDRLSAERGFDPAKNCAQIEEKDGKNLLVISGEACPANGLAGNVVASFTYLESRSLRHSRSTGASLYYVFHNDAPVGFATSAPKQSADAMDIRAMENESSSQTLGTIVDLLALDDMFRAAGEIQIANGSIKSIKSFPALERISREEEMLRQIKETQKMLVSMLEQQKKQFDTVMALLNTIDTKTMLYTREILATMGASFDALTTQMENSFGALSDDMKAGFAESKEQIRIFQFLAALGYADLKKDIFLQGLALKAKMNTLATAAELSKVAGQVGQIAIRLDQTSTKADLTQAVKDVNAHTDSIFTSTKAILETLATKKDVSEATRRITTRLGFQLGKIRETLRSVSTKADIDKVLAEISAMRKVVDTLATSEELHCVSEQIVALQSLTETLATKDDLKNATKEIKDALEAQVRVVRSQLRTVISKQQTMSANFRAAMASHDRKFAAIEKLVRECATKEQARDIAKLIKEANDAIKKLATKEELDAVWECLDASISTLSGDVQSLRNDLSDYLEAQFGAIEELIGKLATKADLTTAVGGLQTELTAIKGKFADLAKSSDVAAQTQRIRQLTGEIRALQGKVSKLATKTQVEAIAMQLVGLKDQVAALAENVDCAAACFEEQLAALNLQIADLATKADVASAKSSIDALKATVESVRAQVKALEARMITVQVKAAIVRLADGASALFGQLKDLLK